MTTRPRDSATPGDLTVAIDGRSRLRPYATTRDYLDDYLGLLALRLQREVAVTRLLRGPGTEEAFLGLFLSEPEVDALLASLRADPTPGNGAAPVADPLQELTAAIDARAAAMAERLRATAAPLRPRTLARRFDLSALELALLLLLLAPEVDSRYARAYAYLQDDVARRWLTPDLALRLLAGTDPADPAGRALFLPASPLLRHRLVRLDGAASDPSPPLLDRRLKLDDRIVEYLLEGDPLEPRLEGLLSLAPPGPALAALPIDPAVATALGHLLAAWREDHDGPKPAFFWGPSGSGRRLAAGALATALDRPLVLLDGAALAADEAALPERLVLARREARLRDGLLYVDRLEALSPAGRDVVLAALGPEMILAATAAWSFVARERPPFVLHFPVPDAGRRRALWSARLNGHAPGSAGKPSIARVPAELADRFRLTPGQIAGALAAARQHACLRDGPGATPTAADLFEGARRQSNPGLDRLAMPVVSPYGWDDLVLPPAQMAQLRAIEAQVRHAGRVYDDWGFGRRLDGGRGLAVLFSGLSGTGKTMTAGILARSLGLDLYKIDLAGVVSKYIGETEKNLSVIFAEAATANAILFFDEADALFGKRSEVRDAHDRYANIEISYLLQRMETYEGISILATNLSQNIDDAFTRRLSAVVAFPVPDAADRERIWRGLFPPEAPLAGDVDFAFLAGQFELTGGHIRNCVLAAAFLAASAGEEVGMDHLVQAVARELEKLGRPLTRAAFADYYGLARQRR